MSSPSETETTLATQIDGFVAPISDAVNAVIFFAIPIGTISLPVVVIWLISAAVILTIRLNFINLRGFGHAWRVLFRSRMHAQQGMR